MNYITQVCRKRLQRLICMSFVSAVVHTYLNHQSTLKCSTILCLHMHSGISGVCSPQHCPLDSSVLNLNSCPSNH